MMSRTHQIVKTIGILERKYPESFEGISANGPIATWKTISAYFKYLCELNMHIYTDEGWYMVVSEHPRVLVLPDLTPENRSIQN
jgi:hypothetical protein